MTKPLHQKIPPMPIGSSFTSARDHAPAAVITAISPDVSENGVRYPVKRVEGEDLHVEADIFKDGHDVIRAVLKWRQCGDPDWSETEMRPLVNDRWAASCRFVEIGAHEFTVEAWPDSWETWRRDFGKKYDAATDDLEIELTAGAQLIKAAAERAALSGRLDHTQQLDGFADSISDTTPKIATEQVLSRPELLALMARWTDRSLATSPDQPVSVTVERECARFSAWYEFFPRSAEGRGDRGSTFRDCLPMLDQAREMGFDVVYFPPIHPIGITNRKGKNNSLTCEPGDPGSPWAIGSEHGGHFAVEPALGTIDDFAWLVGEAHARGLEVAIDFAINCSPDHPYVAEHPDWFFQRPDGSIKYAENPPKRYQDIYPLNFHCADWRHLWDEMRDIVLFWARKGVRIFRVDNPHTKPFAFWKFLIREVQDLYPDTIFLAEAFTRPKLMKMLGKIGFSQSYTYFTWRVHKLEIAEYLTELTQSDMVHYYRGNLWPNTPDILAVPLQWAGPAMFKIRALLASTLSSVWGMYSGYELCENDPHPEREEYNNNEKYQFKERDWNAPGNIKNFIGRLNHIRRTNPALREYENLRFLHAPNDHVLAYAKATRDLDNIIIVIVNLSTDHRQETSVSIPLDDFALPHDQAYRVHDLLNDEIYQWRGHEAYVSLDPSHKVAHILRIERG